MFRHDCPARLGISVGGFSSAWATNSPVWEMPNCDRSLQRPVRIFRPNLPLPLLGIYLRRPLPTSVADGRGKRKIPASRAGPTMIRWSTASCSWIAGRCMAPSSFLARGPLSGNASPKPRWSLNTGPLKPPDLPPSGSSFARAFPFPRPPMEKDQPPQRPTELPRRALSL